MFRIILNAAGGIVARAAAVVAAITAGSLVSSLPTPAAAQDRCSDYKVEAPLLNMRAEPNVFGTILDVLRRNEVVCITRTQGSGGQAWGFVTSKSRPDGGDTKQVNGWTSMRYLSRIEPSADTGSGTAGSAAPAVPTNRRSAGAATAGAATTGAATGASGLSFTDPVPYGPYPVRGRSLEQLANGLPLFSPIDGLPQDRWERNCTECHRWNRDRLCDQGKSYSGNALATLRIQHPYGGPYKKALGDWATSGCN